MTAVGNHILFLDVRLKLYTIPRRLATRAKFTFLADCCRIYFELETSHSERRSRGAMR
jgi:hypothetical protein